MNFRLLTAADAESAIDLVNLTFQEADGEEEARAVSGLVARYFERYPRADLLGFCAETKGELIGCLFFSQLQFERSEAHVFLLSPLAVRPSFQGKGTGKSLIKFAHADLRKRGIQIAVTYGDPRFYGKVGYEPISAAAIAAPHPLSMPEGWIACSLSGLPLQVPGPSRCIRELDVPELW